MQLQTTWWPVTKPNASSQTLAQKGSPKLYLPQRQVVFRQSDNVGLILAG